jgi:hypothetical protein
MDHLVRPPQQRLRDRQAQGFGGLEVDDQLELGGLLDREIGGLGALEDLVYVSGRLPVKEGVGGRSGPTRRTLRVGVKDGRQ